MYASLPIECFIMPLRNFVLLHGTWTRGYFTSGRRPFPGVFRPRVERRGRQSTTVPLLSFASAVYVFP